MKFQSKTTMALAVLGVVFPVLALVFLTDALGRPPAVRQIPLVDTNFLDTSTVRRSYADLVKAKEDLSDFDDFPFEPESRPRPLSDSLAFL